MARTALHRELLPDGVVWEELGRDEPALDLFEESEAPSATVAPPRFRVPKKFIELARLVALHADERRWALLYRLLWRITHGEPKLLEIVIDPEVSLAVDWHKSVRHDIHKMRAFVRFREVTRDGAKWFVAWFEPNHHIVEHNAAFFVDRFASMSWSILTPERCAHWNGNELSFTDGRGQIEGAHRRRSRSALADLLRKHFQSRARQGARDAGRDAEEILAESAGSGADSRVVAGGARTSRRDDEEKRGEIWGERRGGLAARACAGHIQSHDAAERSKDLHGLPSLQTRHANCFRRRTERREADASRRTAGRPGRSLRASHSSALPGRFSIALWKRRGSIAARFMSRTR